MKRLIIITTLFLPGMVLGDSTVDTTQRYSYAANGAWLNWVWDTSTPQGAVVTESLLSGFIYSANFGWINLGDGDPSNGFSYSQTAGEFGDFAIKGDQTIWIERVPT